MKLRTFKPGTLFYVLNTNSVVTLWRDTNFFGSSWLGRAKENTLILVVSVFDGHWRSDVCLIVYRGKLTFVERRQFDIALSFGSIVEIPIKGELLGG